MPKIIWMSPPVPTDTACIVCGNAQNNVIILNASHWHQDKAALNVAFCKQCQSAYTVNASDVIVPYPSAEVVLQDPNFIYLIYQYLEIASGLDWKLPLLERLPYQQFKSILEIGCNVGVTLDYCRTAWGADVLGLEPSAYGIKGAELLEIPIINAYTYEAQELRERKFSFIYATEVLEHVPDPLSFLKEMRTYLESDGILLITTPCSASLRPETLPGELYAVLSPGAHYFLLSQQQLQQLAYAAGFTHCVIELFGNTNIAYLSSRPIDMLPVPAIYTRMMHYYSIKKDGLNIQDRVQLGHLLNYYIYSVKSGESFINEFDTNRRVDEALATVFNISLDAPLALAERVVRVQSIFDLGKEIPYSLPFYLYHKAQVLNEGGNSPNHFYELAALIAVQGLRVDFQNLFLYHNIFQSCMKKIGVHSSNSHKNNHITILLREMIEEARAGIPELNHQSLSIFSKLKRKMREFRKLVAF